MTDSQELAPNDAHAALQRLPLDEGMMAALTDPGHPGHKAANAHRRELYAAAFPEDGPETDPAPTDDKDTSERGTPETREHFATPDRPEDYRFDWTPDDLQHDAVLEQKARVWFHDAGVPQWLARNIVQEWNRLAAQPPDRRDIENQVVATERSLRRAWGDQYDANVAKAAALVEATGSDELAALLDRSGMANSEYLIRQLVTVAEQRERQDRDNTAAP